ncbi:Dynein_heavy chain [Hexamita inflata]|uniref:Dynein heavy chain n=1 Tax=Hexamita inflata TaxID=28002 RepID=A0AA86UFX2_9EUKA|nr:Dynein heavy chain [Hexamita inflata]
MNPPQPLSNSQIMSEKVKNIQQSNKYNPALVTQAIDFSERDYAPYDTDAIRPAGITSASELQNTAMVHPNNQPPKLLKTKINTVEHRASVHNNSNLPDLSTQKFVSQAAMQPRAYNPETAKIRESEHKIKDMKKSSHAIAYFARTPDKAEVKLVFCKPISYQTDNVYEPYELEVVTKQDTETLPVYYTINQNGVMSILNEQAARKLNYSMVIETKRALHPGPPKPSIKIIYQKPTEVDSPESFLTKRMPEMMDPLRITKQCEVLGAFMDDSTEFVQLDRWILESSTFQILRNFKFFREYYSRRAIDQWVQFRKYRNYLKNRAQISYKNFLGKQHFLSFIVDAQKQLINIRDRQCIDLYATMDSDQAQSSVTPTQSQKIWVDAQQRLQRKVTELLENSLENISGSLQQLTSQLKQRASDTIDQEQQNMPLFQKQKLMKTKSIVATKAEQLTKRKEIKTAQEESTQICKLICQTDQMFIEALLMMLNKSSAMLLEAVTHPNTCNGLIQSEIKFSNDQLVFDPSLPDIQGTILNCIDDLITIANKPYQLYQIPGLREYFELPHHWERKGQSLSQIVNKDQDFQTTLKTIQNLIKQQADKLTNDSKSYQQLLPLWNFITTHTEDEYVKQHSNLTCNLKDLLPQKMWSYISPSEQTVYDPSIKEEYLTQFDFARANYGIRPLEREITKFKEWQQILSSKPSQYPSGFAQLDARKLIQTLQNVPQQGLDAVQRTCLEVIKQAQTQTLDKIKTHLKVINQQPQELELFSKFITYLETIDGEMDALISRVQLADDLLNLLTNQNLVQYNMPQVMFQTFGKINQQDQEVFNIDQKTNPNISGLGLKIAASVKSEMESLHNEMNVLQIKKQQAEQYANEQYQLQVKNMQDKILSIKSKYQDVKSAVEKGCSNDHSSDPQVVLKHLKDMIEKIIELIQKSEELKGFSAVITNWYSNLMEKRSKVHVQNVIADLITEVTSTLKKFQVDLENRLNLWNHMNEWIQFDTHILQHNWIENVVHIGEKKQTEIKKEEEGEEEEEEKEKKTEVLDEQTLLIQKIYQMNAEKSCQYIQEMSKDANKIYKQLPDDSVAQYYKQQVVKMKSSVQMMMDLGNPNLQEHHWEEIFQIMDAPQFSYVQPFTFAQLLQANIHQRKQEIQDISGKATGENNLLKQIQKIEQNWKETKPKNKEHKSKYSASFVHIIAGVDELYQQLDDSIAALQSMAGSRFIGRIKGTVTEWEENLTKIQEIYDEMVKCQQSWLYLESIFAPEDIRRQLQSETAQFDVVDKFWRAVLTQIKESNSVVDVLKIDNLYAQLQTNNEELEKIQKKLEDYLETKRFAFPRFYFISNDELLQILSQTTDASSVIPFLRKIFEAISNLTIVEREDKRKIITQMHAPEGEIIDFVQPVVPHGGLVEAWLTALEREMFQTMKIRMKEALLDCPRYGEARDQWIFNHPAQTILAGGQCLFTDAVETALSQDFKLGTRKNMERVKDQMIGQINGLTDLIINNATAQQRKVITPLIVIEVYSRDVCTQLLDPNSESYSQQKSDFGWQKQLKHYWILNKKEVEENKTDAPVDYDCILRNSDVNTENIDSGDLVFKQTDFTFVSGYEYYGISNRLVITPLTTKCYITLTSAISKCYGGNPLGPAGTGKTETCKDLIKTLQVSCLIFNCSDGLDYKSMIKFFCGLSMTGSFSVFDEFNRILVDTLSVISQQILTIQNAVRAKKTSFAFEHYESLPLNIRVGFFITFNPDYEGRSALPENVKALFRPIAMIVPDYALIAENFLFSEGFKNGKILARKMTQLYKLSSEQLSQQPHYDFGMRAIKSILYMAGKLKASADRNASEDILLIRAMQDSNIPKFMAEDIVLFNGIVQDLFPGMKIPKAEYGILETEIRNILKQQGLQDNDEFVTKILQAYDTHIIRHGQMFVGESLTGKSVARNTLAQAITNLAGQQPQFKQVEQYILSAKSITMAELYGELNTVTNEWKDGLVAVLARKILEIKDKKIFLVFDSHVDPVWIENLNTVLDDSKMFCLTNGERIRLSEDSNVMFETRDLNQASPATVSRCGMVYFAQEFIGAVNIFKSQTLQKVEFVKKLMRMISLEEFGQDLTKLQEKAKTFASNNLIIDDEEETVKNKIENTESDLIQQQILQQWPSYMFHYELYEQVLYLIAKNLLEKMLIEFSCTVPLLLSYIRKSCQEEAPTLDFQQINAMVTYISALIEERTAFSATKLALELSKQKKTTKDEKDEGETAVQLFMKALPTDSDLQKLAVNPMAPITSILLDQRFVYSVAWGICGSVKQQFQQQIDAEFRKIVQQRRENQDEVSAILSLQNNLPPVNEQKLTMFDYRLDNSTRYYTPFTDQTRIFGSKSFDPNVLRQGGSVYDMIIPTTQFVKQCTLLTSIIRTGQNAYLCGATGTSKTSVVKMVFSRALGTQLMEQQPNLALESDLLDINTQEIPFSAQTKPETVELQIFEKLDRKRKNCFSPAANRKGHVIFVDDADMPQLDRFGTQLPNELLRQLMFQEGTYDRQKLTFRNVQSIQLVLASQQPGAGRNVMNSRFTSKFAVIGMPELQRDEMLNIFGNLLNGFMMSKQPGFEDSVKRGAFPGLVALVDTYMQVRQEIRATPMKSHYSFNLRDVARVVGGIFTCTPIKVRSEGDILSLYLHECYRVFRDRLVDEQDEEIFDSIMSKNYAKYFQDTKSVDLESETPWFMNAPELADATTQQLLQKLSDQANCPIYAQNLIFGRWTNMSGVSITDMQNQPPYINVTQKPQEIEAALQEIVSELYGETEQQNFQEDIDYQKLMNEKEVQMNIKPVLFKEAIQHYSRMYRVLTQPAGHLLSIGLSGSGRKTLLKLVGNAQSVRAEVEEPTASRTYGLNELMETLKQCYLKSAQGKVVILLLNETSLDAKDVFLEQINSVLNGVPLPQAVWKAEKELVFDIARNTIAAQNAAMGISEQPNLSNQQLWDIFYRVARANFHVCLFLSPVGDQLRKRLRQFPALVNCTTIDWYKIWSPDALKEVAISYLNQIHPNLLNQAPIKLVSEKMVQIHQQSDQISKVHYARTKIQNYVTPPMFMSFLQLFKQVLQKSVGSLKCRQETLSKGLNKLTETSQKVAQMQKELNDLQPVLQQSISDTNELMKKLEKETTEVNKIREVVKAEEKTVSAKAAEVDQAKQEADNELEIAKPAYQKAAKALESFDKNAVLELRSFKSPPVAVKFTMEAVCVLFNTKPDWDSALKLISESNFVQQVQSFDKDNIDQKILINLRKYTQKPDFSVEKVLKASQAASILCGWAKAIDKYAEMFAIIKPKMIQVEELTTQSNAQKAALKIKQDELHQIEQKLKTLEDSFKASESKKQRLMEQVKQTEIDLNNAQKLLGGLQNEYTAWTSQIAEINADLYASVGDALLGSAIIAYLGPYTSDQRVLYIQQWKNLIFTTKTEGADFAVEIPVSEKFKLDSYSACADPRDIKDWKQKYQLPGDAGSIQSAIIVSQSRRFPFIIDPELQGITWLRKLWKSKNVQLSGPSGQQLQQQLENQINIGNPLIIENASEDLDPLLSSVLRKELVKKGGLTMIKIGDVEKQYNPDFRLFVTTRMRQPQFNPDVQAFSQVVNMAVSSKGLEEQLLSLVVLVENPTLETEKDQIISSLTDAKEKQSQLQDELLEMLAQSKDPLKDESLIKKLEESKIQAKLIREQITQGELATKKVDEQRELFRQVAVRGRILYEAIAGLSSLDSMYTYSLEFFKNIFQQTLRKVEAGMDKDRRMIQAITDACFLAVQRGIFERHKPVFAFMIASGIQRETRDIKGNTWRMFMGQFDNSTVSEDLNKCSLSDKQKHQLQALIEATDCEEEFNELLKYNCKLFDEYCSYEQIEAYSQNNPQPAVEKLISKLTPFELLVFNKIVNPNRVLFYIPIYTKSVMVNKIYTSPPNFDIQQTFATTTAIIPLIFVLSTGSDPMLQIQQYVTDSGMQSKFTTLALGQGQGEIAKKLLDRAVKEGNWVCLQNVHLCETWLPTLQKFVESLSQIEVNENFRLILTSMPSKKFPTSVLALSVKIANEPPRSVKQNLLMSYQLMSEEFHDQLDECKEYSSHWKRIVFGIGFFYAQLLERKRFGAIGYNSNYDFTAQDLQISNQFVRQYLIDSYAASPVSGFDQLTSLVPYKPLNFMVGQVAFGGRISDFLDSRCVSTIMGIILQNNLFEPRHQMCPQNANYVAPPFELNHSQTIEYIKKSFPDVELPSLFGLHENAELSYQKSESDSIVQYVQQMLPSDQGSAGLTVQQLDQKVLQQLNEIIAQLPKKLKADEITIPFNIKLADGSEMPSPYASVLRQECQRYNKLLGRISQLFNDTALAVQGLAIMSNELEQVYKGILSNTLPQVIKSASYPSLKSLSSYISNLIKRVNFFNAWIHLEKSSTLVEQNEKSHSQALDKAISQQLRGLLPTNFWLGACISQSRKTMEDFFFQSQPGAQDEVWVLRLIRIIIQVVTVAFILNIQIMNAFCFLKNGIKWVSRAQHQIIY